MQCLLATVCGTTELVILGRSMGNTTFSASKSEMEFGFTKCGGYANALHAYGSCNQLSLNRNKEEVIVRCDTRLVLITIWAHLIEVINV